MKNLILNKSTSLNNPIYFGNMCSIVYQLLKDLNKEYPDFEQWFYGTVVRGIIEGERQIILKESNNTFLGVAILKNTDTEKKICTFRIFDSYKGLGIGTQLMRDVSNILEIKNPKITVSERRIEDFLPLLSKFEYVLHSEHKHYYENGISEFSFNAAL